MYWPYLYSKLNEVSAVLDVAPSIASTRLVVPILHPAADLATLEGRLKRVLTNGLRVAVICNPNRGKPPVGHAALAGMVNRLIAAHTGMVFPAYELRAGAPLFGLGQFAAHFSAARCVLIHRSLPHSALAIQAQLAPLSMPPVQVCFDSGVLGPGLSQLRGVGRVLARDGFRAMPNNGSYPAQSSFSDLLYQYRAIGFDGFSDFGTVGDQFRSGGSTPHHVALHLTGLSPTPSIVCDHFVSTVPVASGIQAKYLNALGLLVKHTGIPPVPPYQTAGVRDFHSDHHNQHYPSLGPPKRYSLKHHFEMVHSELVRLGAAPFV